MSFRMLFLFIFQKKNNKKSLRAPRLTRKGLKDEACRVHFCRFSLIKHTKIDLLKHRGLSDRLWSSSGSIGCITTPHHHHPQGGRGGGDRADEPEEALEEASPQ